MYPLKFKPVYKEKIWGGTAIKDRFNRSVEGDSIGESWEIAAHEEGNSKVANGEFKGKPLAKVVNKTGVDLLGTKASEDDFKKFPLLIKLLDANDKLSVQVHPDDEHAAYHEGELGKTEMWYVIDAKEDAQLIYGINPGVDQEEFRRSIKAGELGENLRKVDIKPGDVLYIPSGTVHAIMEGILLAEIQQNSDTTYRVYDWNRMGKDGAPRELHIDSALEVIDFDGEPQEKVEGLKIKKEDIEKDILVACPYFITEKIELDGSYKTEANGERFYIYMGLEGKTNLKYKDQEIDILAGETVLVPAALGEYELKGESRLLCTYQKELEEFKQNLLNQGISPEELDKIGGF